MSTTGRRALVNLSFADDHAQVVVSPADDDRFVLSMHQAIEACRAWSDEEAFRAQVNLLIRRLARWIHVHQEKIRTSILTQCESGLLFVVVKNDLEFDRTLEDDLSDLELEVAKNEAEFGLIHFDGMAVPPVDDTSLASMVGDNALELKLGPPKNAQRPGQG